MMKLQTMSATTETELQCEFCKRKFVRESSFIAHMCDKKQRWVDRGLQANRVAFNAWVHYFTTQHVATKQKTYLDFLHSPYYNAFLKFGTYCVDINAINLTRFVDWLVRDRIKIDNWCSDRVYAKYLTEYLRTEDSFDAVARTITFLSELTEAEGIELKDAFRFSNRNKLCHAIAAGKISPWALYHSASGIEFLSSLNEDQERIVIDYIDPQQWALKFNKSPEIAQEIRACFDQTGF